MKNTDNDDMREEYDFSALDSVRGKYAKQYAEGTNLVLLDPDVAKAFPTDKAVNDALRMLLNVAEASKRPSRQRKAG